MFTFFRPARAFRYLAPALTVLCGLQLKATSTYVGTVGNASSWSLTYDGPSGNVTGTAIQYTDGDSISISSDGKDDGTFAGAGGSLTSADLAAAFNGVWEGNLDFVLPANAIDVVLTFANLQADDRVVLGLNDVAIGNAGLDGTTNANGIMSFVLDAPLSTSPQDFDADIAGTITTGFHLGATNDLEFIVNNTNAAPDLTHGTNLAAPTEGFQTSGDATLVAFNATISYETTPEPATLFLMGSAMGVLGILRFRRHRMTHRQDSTR